MKEINVISDHIAPIRTSEILITGASGMLGSCLMQNLEGKKTGTFFHTPFHGGIKMDLSKDISALYELPIDVIIHCAALTNVELCENHPELAYDANVKATKNLVALAEKKSALLVYVSTDSVFDGKTGMYSELSQPSPVNVYSQTKLEAENYVKKTKHIILRTSIFGNKALAAWIINNFKQNKQFSGFDDVFFSAIYVRYFADILSKLIKIDYRGTINLCSRDSMSKYEFARCIARVFDFDTTLVKRSSIDSVSMTKRPKNTVLDTSKLQKLCYVPTIEEGICRLKEDMQ